MDNEKTKRATSSVKKSKKKCCNTCNVKTSEEVLPCFLCKNMFHFKCTGMSNEYCNDIISQNQPGLSWMCPNCYSNEKIPSVSYKLELDDLKEQINLLNLNISDRINALENKMDRIQPGLNEKDQNHIQEKLAKFQENLENKVTTIGTDVQEKIHTYAEKVTLNMKEASNQFKTIKSMNENFEGLKTNIETKLADESELKLEEKLIKLKENNICIFNIPESEEVDEKKAFLDDMNKIKQIFNGKMELHKEDIEEIYRTKAKPNTTRARPIIIRFGNVNKKVEALKLRKLIFYDGKENINIFISPDRTRKQQDQHKKLVTELKQRKENGKINK